MNQILFDFYNGSGFDDHARTFEDMYAMSNRELETSHTVVQWVFPLNEPSLHNHTAPLLDDETIEAMKNSSECMDNLQRAYSRWMNFFQPPGVTKPHWLELHNHNYLRITRMLKCFKLFGRDDLADLVFKMAKSYYDKYPNIIGEVTLEFWENALNA